ncbi:MAG: hypothetical protein ACKOA9_14335 [Actinomycetota bacterium]
MAALTFVVLALPASAQLTYPPDVTTTTTQAAADQGKLAFTGSDSTPLVIVAIVALTLGAVLVVAARRRGTVRATRA